VPALTIAQALQLAFRHYGAGQLAEAEALARQILAAGGPEPNASLLLGVISYQTGRTGAALELFQQTVAANPQLVDAQNNLGCVLVALGRFPEAIAAFRVALQGRPLDAEIHSNLGDALCQSGDPKTALAACQTALDLQPGFAPAHNNLGNALRALGQFEAALAAYRRALQLQPDYAEAHNNFGAVLSDRFENEAAVEAFQLALQRKPELVSAHNNLACALTHLGRFDEAVTSYRRAMALLPEDASLHSNLIYGQQFIPDLDPNLLVEEQARWNERHAQPLAASILPHAHLADPDRRLKVGYVSPDFREHPVAFFLAGLFAAHDRTQFETHCYASVHRPDAVTTRLRESADEWHEVAALSHGRLAEKIRADGIDILVDLSMHSAENRLPVFARKPAPVQVSWLAYPGTTGLETIDYRLTDATMEPPQGEAPTTMEHAVHLPDAWCCYEPIGPFPDVGPLPAIGIGHVTFGSFSKTSRLNDHVLQCWARLARRIPEARWLILHPEDRGRERVRQFFGKFASQVEFATHRPWGDYLQLFRRVDLSLDTFPANGMTATCHALWMGTPVVTLAGSSPISRVGASLLSTVGLPELVGSSANDYVEIAATLAGDLPRLAELRATLRDRMQRSPLMDAPRFARNVEAAYRAMWRAWCKKPGRPK
jgi:predicted O-linked N-acetylglucosamine transferase (SPINDLY family)